MAVHYLMMLVTDLGYLDLFDYIPGFPTSDVRQAMTGGPEIAGFNVVTLEWLWRMKRAAGRPKDLLDLEELEKLRGRYPAE